jgi:hypothetical protein
MGGLRGKMNWSFELLRMGTGSVKAIRDCRMRCCENEWKYLRVAMAIGKVIELLEGELRYNDTMLCEWKKFSD